jgi:hypothetical protein
MGLEKYFSHFCPEAVVGKTYVFTGILEGATGTCAKIGFRHNGFK